tara:strand:- start:107521 stop:108738 length:1218 start_codon:yes stop_codon:yes gene_type:complete
VTTPYSVTPGKLEKTIEVPTSKSYANRVLILAAITPGSATISNIPESTDVTKMIGLLQQIGLEIEQSGSTVTVKNSFPECEKSEGQTLLTGDGGTTNRFILPLLARGKQEYILEPEGHMRNRPMEPLTKALKEIGVKIEVESDKGWLSVKGPFPSEARRVEVDCKDSTQFITGLSLASADCELEFVPIGLDASLAYFLMTKHLIEEFKAQQREWEIPVDFSSLGYPLALAAVSGKVSVTNCTRFDDFQADAVFLKVLEEMGAEPVFDKSGLSLVKPEYLMPFEIDGSSCPDLVPTLAFVAAYAAGSSYIRNIEILRHKESDRVEEVLSLLKAFGIEFEFDSKTHNLIIYGNPANAGTSPAVDYNPPADHRIVMVAYLFMRMNAGGTLTNFHHVKKSFPSFFEVLG